MPALPPERLIDLSSLHQSEGVSLGRCGRWVEVRRGWQVTPLQSKPTTGTCSSVTPSAARGWREASVKTRSHTRFIIFNRIKYHKVHTLTAKFSRYTIRFLFYISFWEAATVARRGPHVFFFFSLLAVRFLLTATATTVVLNLLWVLDEPFVMSWHGSSKPLLKGNHWHPKLPVLCFRWYIVCGIWSKQLSCSFHFFWENGDTRADSALPTGLQEGRPGSRVVTVRAGKKSCFG